MNNGPKADWTIRRLPRTTVEVKFTVKISRMVRLRYGIAKVLVRIAGWVINSNIEFVQSAPALRWYHEMENGHDRRP